MFSFCLFALNRDIALADDETQYYYIPQDTLSKTAYDSNIYFRNTSGDKLFLIPCSYYVQIIGEASVDSVPVSYLGLQGTISIDDAKNLTSKKITHYSNQTINEDNAYPTLDNIKLSPNNDSFTVDDHSYSNDQAFVYLLGKSEDVSKVYVMVKMGNSTVYGDADSAQFASKTISAHSEVINFINSQESGSNSNQTNTNNSKALRVILIIGLIIPAVVIALLIFIPKKSEQYDKARMNSRKVGKIDYDKTRMQDPNMQQPPYQQNGYNQYPQQNYGNQQYPNYPQQPQYPPQNNGYYPPQQNNTYYPPQDNGYYPPQNNGYYDPNDPNGGMQ